MCTFRAGGGDFDVDAFLANSSIQACAVFHKGEPRSPLADPHGRHLARSGFNVNVSDKEWDDLPGQIQDAMAFLAEKHDELRRLRAFPGVEGTELRFPIELRDVMVQTDRFPSELLLATFWRKNDGLNSLVGVLLVARPCTIAAERPRAAPRGTWRKSFFEISKHFSCIVFRHMFHYK